MASASPPAPRRSARARRLPPRLADSAIQASTSARPRTARARRPLPQPADGAMASTSSAPRRSSRVRRLPPRLADSAIEASTSARPRAARARRPLPQPASTSARRRAARGPAAQPVFLPDEIWEYIFLRLDAAVDLVRASAACSSFRRIVSEPQFLRRFRSLLSPGILGLITSSGYRRFFPAGPPHRTAPEARALGQAADFVFSFVPNPFSWHFRHARDGRVLLSRLISMEIRLEDFVVCDPLYRRYVMIPRIPDDLIAASTQYTMSRHLLPVLAPAGENDEEGSFRVICTVLFEDKVMAFVFSSCNQTWRGITSTISLPDGVIEYMTYYAHGCLYWIVGLTLNSLMLDISEMKFSIIDLPPHSFDSTSGIVECAIVETADGRLGCLTIVDGTADLYCKNWQSNCVGGQEWLHDKRISLPKDSGITYNWEVEGTAGHYLALVGESSRNSEHIVVDIKTFLVENLCISSNGAIFGFPYARFPPPLELPSI
ncbi:uncharacterized protein LOC8068831 isoform X1 [Sorghum bicolor]|nr:uncharacterized protein LOC8068831 isoform X1 [Sorghum bicolor]XP_021301687.1 uncharacterized protein LOC8068831 isoform X1 [Sorghum bicolor]|eukprot:XP_002443351.1 uncharacterized protein LOC8068831 isoform X1 [Sorghum bicolor]